MAWSAIINSAPYKTNDGNTVVEVIFTDGVSQKFPKSISTTGFDLASFKAAVKAQLDSLDKADTAQIKLPLGPFDPSPTLPTAGEQTRTAYAADVRLYAQMTRAIAIGVKTNADKDFTDTVERLKTNFIASYIDLF